MAIGDLVLNIGTLFGVLFAISRMLVWRQEWTARSDDQERRLRILEELKPVGGVEFLDHARRNATAHQDMERSLHSVSTKAKEDLISEVGEVHEKVNTVSAKVTGLEVETRFQTRILTAITGKLKIPTPAPDSE